MEGVSSNNRKLNFCDNVISNVNAVNNTMMQPVQKYADSTNDKLLKSSANINTTPMDIYDGYVEKKNNIVAVVVANTRHTDKHPSFAAIGTAFGIMETAFFSGVYGLTKAFPVLKKSKIINYFANSIHNSIQIAKKIHPERSIIRNAFTGLYMKALYLIGSGFLLGLATDIYKKIKLTNVNGKIAKNKQGDLNDKGFVAAVNSLNTTENGKNIIKNSIIKNDDKSVTVRFKGVDRAYNISKEELKNASKAYYAISDDKGKVKSFKKKYCKGDGDLLALEIAYEKFVTDVQNGNISKKSNAPSCIYNSAIDEDGKITNSSPEQGYFLLTGKTPTSIIPSNSSDNAIMNIYSKIALNRELTKLSSGNNTSSYIIKLNKEEGERTALYDKSNRRKRLNTDNYYVIKEVNNGCAVIVNSSVSKEKVTIPISQLEKHIAEIHGLNTNN